MEKRKWPWKRKISESESSESFPSHSQRYSDEQESLKESPNDNSEISDDEMKENLKSLREKLSSALANVSAKEKLVKQHAKVAEEAVAGWEKAESEVAALKQQNLSLEVKTSHLESALKECVRQLRQARNEQEKRICDEKSTRVELEKRILDLQDEKKSAFPDPNAIEALEKENSLLKQELVSCCRQLEDVRDLSIKNQSRASVLSTKNLGVEIEMMDDFLEMEESISVENQLRDELHTMIQRVEKIETEKQQLQSALDSTMDSLKKAESRIAEGERMLENVQKELVGKEVKSKAIAANIDSLKAETERERKSSEELRIKCRDLENELSRKIQENGEVKIKQEDLAVAADKLSECQKTIASLGSQLQSLATLEDFFIDTSNIPENSFGKFFC